MVRFRPAPQIIVLVWLVLGPGVARAESVARGPSLAIVDFEYVDTSGEPVDQAAAHRMRLRTLMTSLGRDLAAAATRGETGHD